MDDYESSVLLSLACSYQKLVTNGFCSSLAINEFHEATGKIYHNGGKRDTLTQWSNSAVVASKAAEYDQGANAGAVNPHMPADCPQAARAGR